MATILAIESSCDETSAAIVVDGKVLKSNIVSSQIKSHKRFGGVVPELASRHHVGQITYIIELAMREAGVDYDDLDAVAVTYGPGLVGALLIGVTAAKAIAYAHDLPLIKTNHIAGHIYACNLVDQMRFPLIALVVSGGHTELVYMEEPGSYQLIGETRDDAAGECYDKVGRVMGVPYPGGKHVDEMAQKGEDVYDLPRAMIHEDHYDFSFSGLKSAFINLVHNAEQRGEDLDRFDLSASFQAAVVDVLTEKTMRAVEAYDVNQLLVVGGVAANSGLRKSFQDLIEASDREIEFLVPPLSLCGDNAAMIAAAAQVQYDRGDFSDYSFNAQPGLELYE